MENDDTFRFAPHDQIAAAADQDRLNCLAACIANQQKAGFGAYLDVREANCETCGAAGFNTGWGFWNFACGAEVLTCGEGTVPCPTTNHPRGSEEPGSEGVNTTPAPVNTQPSEPETDEEAR